MNCPNINSEVQSTKKGNQRTENAISKLGGNVMKKIFSFALFSLGYSYEYISQITETSTPGVKRIVNDILNNGIIGFLDKRKKNVSIRKHDAYYKSTPANKNDIDFIDYDEKHFAFTITGQFKIKIKKEDIITKKIISLAMLDSGIIKHQKVAEILDCHRNTVSLNFDKYKAGGGNALIDGRIGQQQDYKFNSKVKAEIINNLINNILMNVIPTKSTIGKALNTIFEEQYSESAVASHLKKIGFIDHKDYLIRSVTKQINDKIDALEYIDPYHEYLMPKIPVEPMKYMKEKLHNINFNNQKYNLFALESKVEHIQSNLQPIVLESLIEEMQDYLVCPFCQSRKILINRKQDQDRHIKTSFGGNWNLSSNMYINGECNECKKEFDLLNDLLKLTDYAKYTPLTQKKICTANLAKSYDAAAISLKQQIGLDINKKQVRDISTQVGNYINIEFKEIYECIKKNLTRSEIAKRHPLVDKLQIDKKYFDKSKYLISIAVDGGRMKLFNWIPNVEDQKRKKNVQWHENKVFRISIYDKKDLVAISDDIDGVDRKQKYKCAKIIPELTVYAATNVSWKESANLLHSHLYMIGIAPDDVDFCLSDGSDHILNGVFLPLFPKKLYILDYYHKSEALHSCLKSLGLNDDKEINSKLKKFLWEGKIENIIKRLKKIQLEVGFPKQDKKRNVEDPKVKLDNLINHLDNNKERLRYKEYRDKNYPIGSGSIESAVKLFGKRIKGTEKQWNEDGGESILHLYSFLLSKDNRWDNLWKYQTPWIVKR
jgi:hypothetical protein